jgi:ATP-dependent protease ClpP protease subunit
MKLIEAVKDRGKKKYSIYLVMDTPGGSIAAGESFIEFAKTLPNIHTISLFAASMGSAIVEALPGNRLITASGIMMFHRAKGNFRGQFETGEVEAQLKFWQQMVRSMEARNAKRMNMSLADYKDKVRNEWWSRGGNAVIDGMVDEVVTVKCSQVLIDKREVGFTKGLFGASSAVFSGCPLIQNPISEEKL